MAEYNVERMLEAAQAFQIEGTFKSSAPYGSGHINSTYAMVWEQDGKEVRYILQRVNTDIFKDPVSLMKNIEGVTEFLRKEIIENNGDPERETLNLVPAKDGKKYYQDSEGGFWRAYIFIENATCYNLVEKPEDFYQSGKAFGHFQRLLAQYPAEELSETIPNFHNTPVRFETFKKAIEEDVCGRAASVKEEIQFVMDRQEQLGKAMDMLKEGKLPLRVTHNDTKLNNIMIDDATGQAICIIDLDTIMPGLSIFDYGDSIRFGANTAEEEGSLTEAEMDMLPMGAKLMTLECGMRFLTDYLQGDVYFRTSRENHNLDRTHTQFALVADMENKWSEMKAVVEKYK